MSNNNIVVCRYDYSKHRMHTTKCHISTSSRETTPSRYDDVSSLKTYDINSEAYIERGFLWKSTRNICSFYKSKAGKILSGFLIGSGVICIHSALLLGSVGSFGILPLCVIGICSLWFLSSSVLSLRNDLEAFRNDGLMYGKWNKFSIILWSLSKSILLGLLGASVIVTGFSYLLAVPACGYLLGSYHGVWTHGDENKGYL